MTGAVSSELQRATQHTTQGLSACTANGICLDDVTTQCCIRFTNIKIAVKNIQEKINQLDAKLKLRDPLHTLTASRLCRGKPLIDNSGGSQGIT